MSPSGDTSSHALGEKKLEAEDQEIRRVRGSPGRWKGKSRTAPAAAEDFRKTRRGTITDIDTAPTKSDAPRAKV
jgi:hypothetical protein